MKAFQSIDCLENQGSISPESSQKLKQAIQSLPYSNSKLWKLYIGLEGGEVDPPIDPDALDFIARVEAEDGEPLEPAVRRAINRVFVSAKAGGVWNPDAQFTLGCAARTMAGALVPVTGPALVNTNFVSGDYDRVIGLTPSPGKYLQGVAGDTYGQDDFTLFAFITSPIVPLGSTMRFFGSVANTSGATAYVTYPEEVFAFRSKSSVIVSSVSPDGFTGFFGVERTGPTEARAVMGPIITTSSTASGGNASVPVQYFTYSSSLYSGCPSMTSFFYGPYADATIWRTILNQFHTDLEAALS